MIEDLMVIYNNNNFYGTPIKNLTVNPLLAEYLGGDVALLYAVILQKFEECSKYRRLDSKGEMVMPIAEVRQCSGLKRGKIEVGIKKLVEMNLITCSRRPTLNSSVPTTHFAINTDSELLQQIIDEAYAQRTGYEAVRA